MRFNQTIKMTGIISKGRKPLNVLCSSWISEYAYPSSSTMSWTLQKSFSYSYVHFDKASSFNCTIDSRQQLFRIWWGSTPFSTPECSPVVHSVDTSSKQLKVTASCCYTELICKHCSGTLITATYSFVLHFFPNIWLCGKHPALKPFWLNPLTTPYTRLCHHHHNHQSIPC